MSTPAGKRGRWFLPDTPDVLGMLRRQADITADGMAAFAAWAAGDTARADDVRRAEHECDDARRTLVDAISEAFTTPLEPEDLFQLSFELDRVINGAKNTVRESEAMQFPPDASSAQMAALLAEGVQHLRRRSRNWMAARTARAARPRRPTPPCDRSGSSSASTAKR